MSPACALSKHLRSLASMLLVALALALAVAAPALAQSSGGAGGAQQGPAALSTKDLQALIGTLENDAKRKAFVEELKTLVAARQATSPAPESIRSDVVGAISDRLAGIDAQVKQVVNELDNGSALAAWLVHQVTVKTAREQWIAAAWQVGLTLVMAIAGWLLFAWLVRAQLRRLERTSRESWLERMLVALGRTVLLLVPVAAFAAGAYLTMMLITPDGFARAIAVTLINAVVAVRLVMVVARTLFSPLAPGLRPMPMNDEQAAYLFVWTGRFAAVGIYGFFAIDLLHSIGLPPASFALLVRLVGLVLTAMAMIVVMQSREVVSDWIRRRPGGGGARVLLNRLADIWHALTLIAIVAVFVVWALAIHGGFVFLLRGFGVTGLALFGALLATTMVRRFLHRLFHVAGDLQRRFPGLERRANRYIAAVTWAVSLAIWGVATMIALEAWGLSVFQLFATPAGVQLVSRIAAIVVILLVAIVVWELGDGIISRSIARDVEHALSPRLKTLLPLMRNALLVTIAAISVITIMSEVGINIAPLLAGAGVVGLAIGFGAQTLVKDIITGAFMLFEDQFSVGDWIDAGGKSGGVESITIRTVRLRDMDGYVHTIPFGDISVLTNMMRDFGYAVLDIGVAYKENTDEVIEVIRDVDRAAREDEEFAAKLAGDLEVFGVNALGDSAVTIRCRVRTLAGYQWGVRREYLRRIKLKFDEVGIEIPFPHMTVWFGELKGGKPAPVAHVRIEAGDVPHGDDGKSLEEAEDAPPSPTDAPDVSPPVSGDT